MRKRFYLLLLFFLNVITASTAQPASSYQFPENGAITIRDSLLSLQDLPARYFNKVSAKTDKLNHRLTKSTDKALRRLQKQEEKIHKQWRKVDAIASHNFFTRSIDSLTRLREALKSKADNLTGKIPGSRYLPYLDTLKNALHFLNKYSNKTKGIQQQLRSSLGSIRELEGRMQQVRQIRQYISRRKQRLQQVLSDPAFAKVMTGKYGAMFKKSLGKIGKEAYYYKAQIKNYKELWQQPDKLEAKTLSMLRKIPAFNNFMKAHSVLASLFHVAGGASGNLEESLEGLQTRDMVQQELQQRLQSAGTDGNARIRQQMAAARQKLKELKDKLTPGGSTASMPDFKPKDLKSKTLFQRLEFGGNIQFSKPARFNSVSGISFPTTSDIAGQVAYQFSEKGSIGIGAAFKLGWGSFDSAQEPSFGSMSTPLNASAQEPSFGSMSTPLNASAQEPSFGPGSVDNFIGKIHFTAQGVGLRSFINYKIRGSIYLNGGIEMNYNKTIPRIPELKGLNGWTSSALLGIEKKYRISEKLKGNMMLLFDFLYKQHIPRTQPMVFRVGYNF